MGNRCTFITQEAQIKLPDWFIEKYKSRYNFLNGNSLPLSTISEIKRHWDDMEEDFVKVLNETGYPHEINGVFLYNDLSSQIVTFTKLGVTTYHHLSIED